MCWLGQALALQSLLPGSDSCVPQVLCVEALALAQPVPLARWVASLLGWEMVKLGLMYTKARVGGYSLLGERFSQALGSYSGSLTGPGT
jgi:hypothetical protein